METPEGRICLAFRSHGSYPCHIAVGSNQHCGRSSDRAKYRKLPCASVRCGDYLYPIRPRTDAEAASVASPTEVKEHRLGIVQQRKDSQRAVASDQIEIGHAPPEQRVSLTSFTDAEIIVNIQARHHPTESPARLIHTEEFGHGVAQGVYAVVWAK